MSIEVLELAQKYYPTLWPIDRLNALLATGKLTQEEYDSLVTMSSTDGIEG